MKNTMGLKMAAGFMLAVCLAATPRAFAVAGVGDTTIIVGDVTDTWKWPRELAQWTTLINNTTAQIQKADAMIKLAGNPSELAGMVMETVADVTKPADDAVGLQNREDALAFGKAVYGLGSTAFKTVNDANHVGDEYQAWGKMIKRDPKRFVQYAEQQALYARYQKAADNERTVMKAELALQKRTLDKMQAAKTQSEIELLKAQIEASKQRQDIAHQTTQQAWGELDAYRGNYVYEQRRKEEADREWAESMVRELRSRALASYNAQANVGGTTTN